MNAARIASSVLPNPTSPHSSRSIGRDDLHVALDIVDRRELIRRFLVRKRRIKLALPLRVGRKRDARPRIARGLQLDHLAGQIGDGLLRRLLLPHPRLAADVGENDLAALAADILLHELDLRARHIDLRAAAVLKLQMLFGPPILLQQPQPAIPPDAVRHVHDQVALAQLQKTIDRPRLPPPRRPRRSCR